MSRCSSIPLALLLALLGACDALGGGSGGGAIAVPSMNERVTGVLCTGPGACIFGTDSTVGDPTHLYLTDGNTVTATLVTADSAYADSLGAISPDMPFGPIQQIDGAVYAELLGATGSVAVATGDPTQPASWTTSSYGVEADGGDWGGGPQVALASANGKWTYFSSRQVLEASAGPASATSWATIWAPQASPPVPIDIDDQRAADPTLCDSEPYVGKAPTATQMGYLAPDRSMIAYPAGSPLVIGDDAPGVCISVDGGHSFHLGAIPGAVNGPNGIACTSKDHCVAYADVPNDPSAQAAYVWVSNDASKGAASTWTAAAIPTPQSTTSFDYAFFAADAMHGWLLGYTNGATAILDATSDGGATWTDVADKLGPHDDLRLWAGTAIDATHILVGGETVGGDPNILFAVSM